MSGAEAYASAEATQPPFCESRKAGDKRSSREGHRADALALRADERRDKLRKAPGRSTYPSIRRSLNGETRLSRPQPLHAESIGMQGEPGELKHLSTRRKRKKFDSVSSGERTRKSPNRSACAPGFGLHKGSGDGRRTVLERPAGEGESPVSEARASPAGSRVPRDT